MKFTELGLELDKDNDEQRILSQVVGQSVEIIGDSDLEDFFDRFGVAAPAVSWGKDAWEGHKLDEKTHFLLNEAGNLVIPTNELGVLYQGVKKVLSDPIYNADEYTSEKGEVLKEAVRTLEDNLPEISES